MKKTWANALDPKSKRVGVVLRNIRTHSGKTMRQLAMVLDISHTAISHAEHGKLWLPRYRQEKWVLACGYTVEDYDKLIGSKTKIINYELESQAILKGLEGKSIELAYLILSKIKNADE